MVATVYHSPTHFWLGFRHYDCWINLQMGTENSNLCLEYHLLVTANSNCLLSIINSATNTTKNSIYYAFNVYLWRLQTVIYWKFLSLAFQLGVRISYRLFHHLLFYFLKINKSFQEDWPAGKALMVFFKSKVKLPQVKLFKPRLFI